MSFFRSNSVADRIAQPRRSTRSVVWTLIRGALLSLAVGVVTLTGCQASRGATPTIQEPAYRILGYVGGDTDIGRIDASKLTHINYAFAQVNDDGEAYFRNPDAPADLAQLQALKAKNPDLKILVSVGGWGADGFSDAALTDSSRAIFARSAVEMVRRYGLDGFDVDWEFPGQPGPGIEFREEDEQNFTLMLKSLREHLDALSDQRGRTGHDRYLLTIASNDNQRFFDHTEMDRLHIYLDFINVMTYDMFTSGSATTGHHTGLYRSSGPDAPERTSESAIARHLDAGIPPEKIVLGVAFYGRGWEGVAPQNNGLFQPYEQFAGAWGYQTIMNRFTPEHGFERFWDDAAQAPYLWNPDSSMFISYDDPESLRRKAAFVREHKLGGIMYWEHSHDPEEILLSTISEALRPRR